MSLAELIVIAIVALVLFGPEKLPKIAYQAGKIFKKWQNISSQLSNEIEKQALLGENQARAEKADKLYKQTPE